MVIQCTPCEGLKLACQLPADTEHHVHMHIHIHILIHIHIHHSDGCLQHAPMASQGSTMLSQAAGFTS